MNEETKVLNKIISLKKMGYKIGLVHGVFDLVHSGHIEYFKEAKNICDYLVVSVTSDKFVNKGFGRPLFKLQKRIENLRQIRFLDFVVESDYETSVQVIKKIKPNFYIKGKDYKKTNDDLSGNIIKEISEVKKNGGKFITTNTPLFSSTKIINNDFGNLKDDIRDILKKIDKKKVSEELKNLVNNKINKKILVIGEQIIDKYSYVEPTGKSVKNNIIASKFLFEKMFGGGTILVANILSEFVKNVDLLTIDNKYNNSFLNKTLNSGIKQIKVKDQDTKITVKNRYLDSYSHNMFYQVNTNDTWSLKESSKSKINQIILDAQKKYDAIVVFNFGHGLFTSDIIKTINKKPKKNYINCQSNSSNFGFNLVSKFNSANCICMDSAEFRLNFQEKYADLKKIIQLNSKAISKYNTYIITQGKNGCYINENKKTFFIPTINTNPKDTTGSGDTFFSIMIVTKLLKKLGCLEAGMISHIAAGLHSSHIGNNNVLNPIKILKSFQALSNN